MPSPLCVCGHQFLDDALFCRKCGAARPEDGYLSDEDDELSLQVSDEMDKNIDAKERDLQSVKQEKQEIQSKLETGEADANHHKLDASNLVAAEAQATECLLKHHSSLKDFAEELTAKRGKAADQQRAHTELAKRFEEKLALAAEAATKTLQKLEEQRQASRDAAARNADVVREAMMKKTTAQTGAAAAKENHAAMVAALAVLETRVQERYDEVQSAERELDAMKIAQKSVVNERDQADVYKRKSESEAIAAAEAVVAHTGEATRRNRAHGVEIRRAKEQAASWSALRDMRTRGQVTEADAAQLVEAKHAAENAAKAAEEALKKAQDDHDASKQQDDNQLKVLQVVAERSAKNLKNRSTIAVSVETRVSDREAAMQEVENKYAIKQAAYKAVLAEYENLKQRVEETLAQAVPEHEALIEETTKALDAAKQAGEEEQTTMRYGEEAECVLFKSQQAEETSLKRVLHEARTAAAEARVDVILATDDTKGSQVDTALTGKISEAEARLAECERRDQEANVAHQKAAQEAQSVKSQLDESSDSEMDDEIIQQFKAQHQQQVALVEETLRQKMQDSKGAAQAKVAAQEEVESLRKQQKMTQLASNLEKLVLAEIAIVDKGLQEHKDKEREISEGVQIKLADWAKEKESLGAELHRAHLKVTLAQDSLHATKSLVDALGKGPAQRSTM